MFKTKIVIESKLNIKKLIQNFGHQQIITSEDVKNFYSMLEEKLSSTTINWRIHKLAQSGIISRVGRGKYVVGSSPSFKPIVGKKERSIAKAIKKQFPFIEFCLWRTEVISELSLHQSFTNFILVEVERESMESVFHFLKDKDGKVYFKPDKNIIENHLLELKDIVVVQNLTSEAPLQNVNNVPTVTLEKVLVDLVSTKDLFYYYKGYEMQRIFQQAFDKYIINESKLLRYADRRKKKAEVVKIINAISRD